MDIIVRYSDYNDMITDVEIPLSDTQRKTIQILESEIDEEGNVKKTAEIKTIDDTISFEVSNEMDRTELRNYIRILQKMLIQMSK